MIDPVYQQIGAALRQRRNELGMTQSALASHLGLSRTSVTNIECGRQPMLVHQLLQASRVLKLNLEGFFKELRTPEPIAEDTAAEKFEQLLAQLQPARADKQ